MVVRLPRPGYFLEAAVIARRDQGAQLAEAKRTTVPDAISIVRSCPPHQPRDALAG